MVSICNSIKFCLFPGGVQSDEGPIRLHPQSYGPLQADSLTNLEALPGDPDLYHHEPPAGGSTGKHMTSDTTNTTLTVVVFYLENPKSQYVINDSCRS